MQLARLRQQPKVTYFSNFFTPSIAFAAFKTSSSLSVLLASTEKRSSWLKPWEIGSSLRDGGRDGGTVCYRHFVPTGRETQVGGSFATDISSLRDGNVGGSFATDISSLWDGNAGGRLVCYRHFVPTGRERGWRLLLPTFCPDGALARFQHQVTQGRNFE
ncbi:MAG: hypothetical protein K9J37_11725 [Saprospiraceae bacterium]|nr:hypothetical protein [Saprospiraceae bacterium]MCF8250576.1 hypothetical protein [Saprospiraceae bacterium]MCF8282806.1 hypothetical protein [Bacteroidales bacterium]MCF8313105.1 hypothetical protein [Saprospiraceae bacterium]MCF8441531.1 hypothetical protein [Saprospiraceae bacterium]